MFKSVLNYISPLDQCGIFRKELDIITDETGFRIGTKIRYTIPKNYFLVVIGNNGTTELLNEKIKEQGFKTKFIENDLGVIVLNEEPIIEIVIPKESCSYGKKVYGIYDKSYEEFCKENEC